MTDIDQWLMDVETGWHPLLRKIDAYLTANTFGTYEIEQVKEKFGGLRFYFLFSHCCEEHYEPISVDPDAARAFVDQMENESFTVCEFCGRPGRLRTDRSWLKTLCDTCA